MLGMIRVEEKRGNKQKTCRNDLDGLCVDGEVCLAR